MVGHSSRLRSPEATSARTIFCFMFHFISVVIPAYNEEKLIGRCVDSLQKQDYPRENFKIIVVDHRSTDKTSEVAKEHGAKVLRYTEDNATIGATRQYGSKHAIGEIFAYVDADSVPAVDWLSRINYHMQDEKIVCVGGIAILDTKKKSALFMITFYNYFLLLNQFFGKTLPWGFNLAVRKNALKEINGFDKSLKTSEDWDLALRLAKKFGRKSVMYCQDVKVTTSARRYEQTSALIPYLIYGTKNYINVALLGKSSATSVYLQHS